MVKNPPANAENAGLTQGWKIPWRRKWQPTPVLLPGKSHRQRSLAGCSPWGCKRVRHNQTTTIILLNYYQIITYLVVYGALTNKNYLLDIYYKSGSR